MASNSFLPPIWATALLWDCLRFLFVSYNFSGYSGDRCPVILGKVCQIDIVSHFWCGSGSSGEPSELVRVQDLTSDSRLTVLPPTVSLLG